MTAMVMIAMAVITIIIGGGGAMVTMLVVLVTTIMGVMMMLLLVVSSMGKGWGASPGAWAPPLCPARLVGGAPWD